MAVSRPAMGRRGKAKVHGADPGVERGTWLIPELGKESRQA